MSTRNDVTDTPPEASALAGIAGHFVNARRQGAHAFYESLGFAQHGLSFVVETLT